MRRHGGRASHGSSQGERAGTWGGRKTRGLPFTRGTSASFPTCMPKASSPTHTAGVCRDDCQQCGSIGTSASDTADDHSSHPGPNRITTGTWQQIVSLRIPRDLATRGIDPGQPPPSTMQLGRSRSTSVTAAEHAQPDPMSLHCVRPGEHVDHSPQNSHRPDPTTHLHPHQTPS
jgi:hypothetical protein